MKQIEKQTQTGQRGRFHHFLCDRAASVKKLVQNVETYGIISSSNTGA